MKRTLLLLALLGLASVVCIPVLAQGGGEASQATQLPGEATPPPPAGEGLSHAVLNPVGIALAALFVFFMVNLFRWMFRVPPQLPWSVVKARQSVSALHRILVPLSQTASGGRADDGASERVVELACRLGETQKAEIVLAYVVEVPFTLSLTTPMPEEEARGHEALRTAQFIVEQHGLPVRAQLLPYRHSWGGILRLAQQEMVDAIIMAVGDGRPGQPEAMSRAVQEVLKNAPCEVILDRAPG